MKAQLNDEELIRQHFETNPNLCFETLYKRYVGKVYSRCLSITKDADNAHDFTQDIFMRTFSRLDRFAERSTFSTWLYSISYNYCMDQIRLSKRMATTILNDEMEYADAEETEELEERSQHLAVALNNLTPQEATILHLKYEAGLDIHQIAQHLQLNESAVKMRLKRTRDKIRQFYDQVAC